MIRKKATDYTLIHSMNIDDAGHKFGADSKEYVQAAVRVDAELSQYIWRWMSEGYQIVVTSDHGMNDYHTITVFLTKIGWFRSICFLIR